MANIDYTLVRVHEELYHVVQEGCVVGECRHIVNNRFIERDVWIATIGEMQAVSLDMTQAVHQALSRSR